MKYHFELIENGTIERGVTVVTILNYEANIDNADTDAALLAEQHGGVLVEHEKPARKGKKELTDNGS